MEAVTELLGIDFSTINNTTLTIIGFLCILAIVIILKYRKKIIDLWNYMYSRRKNKEDFYQSIKNAQEEIKETKTEIKQIIDNRIHDREQSFKIQKELTDAQKELAQSITSLSQKIDEMQHDTNERFLASEEKNNKRIRAELKDRIGQSYRYYHEKQKINDMEFEALEDLIASYESANGENSFVHSVVQKEMYTWEKVKRV